MGARGSGIDEKISNEKVGLENCFCKGDYFSGPYKPLDVFKMGVM